MRAEFSSDWGCNQSAENKLTATIPHSRLLQAYISLNKEDSKLYDVYRVTLSTGDLELVCKNPGEMENSQLSITQHHSLCTYP